MRGCGLARRIRLSSIAFLCMMAVGSCTGTGDDSAQQGPNDTAEVPTAERSSEIDGVFVIETVRLFSELDGSEGDRDAESNGVLDVEHLTVRASGIILIDVPIALFRVSGTFQVNAAGAIQNADSTATAGVIIIVEAGESILMTGNSSIESGGSASGGTITLCASHDIDLRGAARVAASAGVGESLGGTVSMQAGGLIVLRSGASRVEAIGASGGEVTLVACGQDTPAILIKGRVSVEGEAGAGGAVVVESRQSDITVQGALNRIVATGSTADGSIDLTAATSVTSGQLHTDPPAVQVEDSPSADSCDLCAGSDTPVGACCLPDGSCLVVPFAACAELGGEGQQEGTECPADCPAPLQPPPPVLDPHPTLTNSTPIVIHGTAPGAHAIEVSGPEGVFEVTPLEGSFVAEVALTPNMVNRVFFTSIDEEGVRSAPASTAITHDGQAPILFIDFPEDGAEITTMSTDVAGRVGDAGRFGWPRRSGPPRKDRPSSGADRHIEGGHVECRRPGGG